MAKWSNPTHNRHVLIVANYTITVVMDASGTKGWWRVEAGEEWAGGGSATDTNKAKQESVDFLRSHANRILSELNEVKS